MNNSSSVLHKLCDMSGKPINVNAFGSCTVECSQKCPYCLNKLDYLLLSETILEKFKKRIPEEQVSMLIVNSIQIYQSLQDNQCRILMNYNEATFQKICIDYIICCSHKEINLYEN